MNVIEQVRQHDAYHAEDATRECGEQCEFEPSYGLAADVRQLLEEFECGPWRGPDWKLCPLRMQSSIEAYKRGQPVGDFLRAVLSNDLSDAIARADDVNIHALPHIVAYVREHLPASAWGSAKDVSAWLNGKNLIGDNDPRLAPKMGRALGESDQERLPERES